MSETYDHKLIESCKEGDRKAQKRVYDLLAPKMMSVCMRYCGDRTVAEDLLQDGFVTLFTKIDSFKGEGSFEGWARRVFVTTCLMYLRKNDALRESGDIEEARFLTSDTPTQLEDIGYSELMKLVMQLPPGFRTVFNMYAIEGYSHREIAQALGVTETTSRTQLSRARLWLQARIKELTDGRK